MTAQELVDSTPEVAAEVITNVISVIAAYEALGTDAPDSMIKISQALKLVGLDVKYEG